MHLRKLLLVVIAVAAVTFSVGLQGQGLIDGIKVTLPEPVTVGDKVLQPGEYEIRRPSSVNRDVLQIFNNDKMVYETNVLTVPTGADKENPKDTRVLLHHIGDAYYFDKIWMEDKNYGWEFPLPDRVRALQRETAVNVPARYEGTQSSSPDQALQAEAGPGLAAELDAIAAAQGDPQALALAESESQSKAEQQADHERQEQLERDRKAEADRQADLDRERQERDRVAALQPEPAPVTPSQSDARVAQPQSNVQSNSNVPDQLPETATNWLALLVSGVLLLTLSFVVRPARAQE